MKNVSLSLPDLYIKGMEDLVRLGMYSNRSTVIRSAVRDLLKLELWEKNQKSKVEEGSHSRAERTKKSRKRTKFQK